MNVLTTAISSSLITAISSYILSRLLTRQGIEKSWTWVIKPIGVGVYNLIIKTKEDEKDETSVIDRIIKSDSCVYELLEPHADENGFITRYILFDNKNKMILLDPVEL
jgi:hypothetical protein